MYYDSPVDNFGDIGYRGPEQEVIPQPISVVVRKDFPETWLWDDFDDFRFDDFTILHQILYKSIGTVVVIAELTRMHFIYGPL